jgi:hypothetical protein
VRSYDCARLEDCRSCRPDAGSRPAPIGPAGPAPQERGVDFELSKEQKSWQDAAIRFAEKERTLHYRRGVYLIESS